MFKFLQDFENYIHVFLLVITILLVAGFVFVFYKVEKLEGKLVDSATNPLKAFGSSLINRSASKSPAPNISETGSFCNEACRLEIEEIVANTISTLSQSSPVPTTQAETQASTQTSQTPKVAYIPIISSGSTTNTDWTTIDDAVTIIDLKNDYNSNATATWDATIKIANANGIASARLYDTTHNIAVNGSEVSTTSGTSTQVVSGNLSFWAGKNTYKVQIKSNTSQSAIFSSGRIKIVY